MPSLIRRASGVGPVPARDRAAHPRRARPVRRSLARPHRRAHRRRSRGDPAVAAAFPACGRGGASCVIDTHAHLDALDDPDEAVERAPGGGVTRILTVGTTVEGCRVALELADRHAGGLRDPRHPPTFGGRGDEDAVAEVRELLDHPKAVAVGEIGLDHFRDYAPHDAQRLALRAVARDRPRDRKARRDPHSRRRRRHARGARRLRRQGRAALLLVAGAPAGGARPRLLRLVRRQRHLPEGVRSPRRCRRRCRPTGSSPRPTAPYLAPQPVRGRQNEPAYVVHTLAALAEARGEEPAELERTDRRERARAAFGLAVSRRAEEASSASTSSSTRTSSA